MKPPSRRESNPSAACPGRCHGRHRGGHVLVAAQLDDLRHLRQFGVHQGRQRVQVLAGRRCSWSSGRKLPDGRGCCRAPPDKVPERPRRRSANSRADRSPHRSDRDSRAFARRSERRNAPAPPRRLELPKRPERYRHHQRNQQDRCSERGDNLVSGLQQHVSLRRATVDHPGLSRSRLYAIPHSRTVSRAPRCFRPSSAAASGSLRPLAWPSVRTSAVTICVTRPPGSDRVADVGEEKSIVTTPSLPPTVGSPL